MATLALEQVSKVYDNGVLAVSELDLFVGEGEFVVLVGPSGCGKTTALRVVAGLEDVTAGTIRLDGRDVTDETARERDVAMVFQNYALYPHLDVLENIGFSLEMRGVPKHERLRRAREAAEVLGLSEVLDRKPRELSGGQRQRVAMGRALVREPSVFLMDEPLSNLDAKLRVQMRSEVLRIQRRLGVAALYVTHDQTEAMTMGDRVAVLREGVLQQFASPRELYERPANLFVASFMGSPSMNLYNATIATGGARPEVRLGSQPLAVPEAVAPRLAELAGRNGHGVVVGIRPEHLTVVPPGDSPGHHRLAADVELVEALGNEQLVHFSIDAEKVRDESEIWLPGDPAAAASGEIASAGLVQGVARVDPRSPVAAGERIAFQVDPVCLHFFDAETGAALSAEA
jgi:multiple sugar transport system ATP-binding protein